MFRVSILALAALIALAPSFAAARERRWKPTQDDQFYVACYIFTSGDNLATAFPPVKVNGYEMFNNFENNVWNAVKSGFPQHHNIRCVAGDTPAEAIENRIAHGYALEEHPWPKGMPEAARPFYIDGKGMVPKGSVANETFYIACYAFQPSAYKPGATPSVYLPIVRATGAEFTDDLSGKVARSILPGQPPGSQAFCRVGDTPEAAQEVRGSVFLKSAEIPWPKNVRLASLGPNAPPAPPVKKAPAPKGPAKPIVIPALTVKEDTGPRDAAQRWEATVKRTLAAQARVKAETAAKALQQDAELKVKIEAFFAERRRQGSRQ